MKRKLALLFASILGAAVILFVLFNKDGMFALVYGPAILLPPKTQCFRAPPATFPPPIHVEGIFTDSSGLEILGGAANSDIDSIALALIKSHLKYIEIKADQTEGRWPELLNSNPNSYVVASWSITGDSRCSRYAEFLGDRPTPNQLTLPWLREVPQNRCVALETADTPKSEYGLVTLIPDENQVSTWTYQLMELASHRVYASQPVSVRAGKTVPNGCAIYYDELNKEKFRSLILSNWSGRF